MLSRRRSVVAARPGKCLLDRRRQAEQQGFAAEPADELHADRQAVRRLVQGQADRRLARGVEHGQEGLPARPFRERVARRRRRERVVAAYAWQLRAKCGGEQDVVPREELRHQVGQAGLDVDGRQQLRRRDATAVLDHLEGRALDGFGGHLPAEHGGESVNGVGVRRGPDIGHRLQVRIPCECRSGHLDVMAQTLQQVRGGSSRLDDDRIGVVAGPRLGPPGDAKRTRGGGEGLGERHRRTGDALGVADGRSAEHIEECCGVANGARHGELHRPPEQRLLQVESPRNPTSAGLESDDAACRRGDSDRAAPVAGQRHRHDPCAHDGARSTARSARHMVDAPRRPGEPLGDRLGRAHDAELRRRRAAHARHARGRSAPVDLRRVADLPALGQSTPVSARKAGLPVEEVLDHRRAPRRAARRFAQRRFVLGVHVDDAVDPIVAPARERPARIAAVRPASRRRASRVPTGRRRRSGSIRRVARA